MEFGPDGYLYVTRRTTDGSSETSFLRFDATTGTFVDVFPLGRDGWSFIFGPDGLIYNSSNGMGNFVERLEPSSLAIFTVRLSEPSPTEVTVDFFTVDRTALADLDYVGAFGRLERFQPFCSVAP